MKTNAVKKLRDMAFINAFISIVDNKLAVIENVTCINECNEVFSSIDASGFTVKIWGSELCLSSFENNVIEISGNISSIELEKKSGLSGK